MSRVDPAAATAPPVRVDGYAPLRDYGVIGDKRTVALVARDGCVDWLPLPTLDGPSVFAALLDSDRGGRFALAPSVAFGCAQRYVQDTNVLETVFETDGGVVRVTDALALPGTRILPWVQLIRQVEAVSGSVPMAWRIQPRFDDATTGATVGRAGSTPTLSHGVDVLAVEAFAAGEPVLGDDDVRGAFELATGDCATIALSAFHDAPLTPSTQPELGQRLEATIAHWRRWSASIDYDGPWPAAVRRSALALDLLVDAQTGAIAAAATMGLPERIGGGRNYDYRYGWVRDANLTLEAMLSLGLGEQVHASLAWMLASVRATHPRMAPMYRLDGSPAVPLRCLDHRGYRDSRPVLRGNGARDQLQLGSYADLFDMVWKYTRDGGALTAESSLRLAEVADHLAAIWTRDDSGVWELPEQRPYTQSKLACWVALDRAVALGQAGHLPASHLSSWRREATAIAATIRRRGWSATRQAYTRCLDGHQLDAGLLLSTPGSFLEQDGDRLGKTIAAIRRELGAGGPLVYRATGMADVEGAFLPCSFWIVENLARLGRVDDAAQMFEALLEVAGPTGLLSEEVDPTTGELLGNLPQALSHLALIKAAVAIREASGSRAGPSDARRRSAGS